MAAACIISIIWAILVSLRSTECRLSPPATTRRKLHDPISANQDKYIKERFGGSVLSDASMTVSQSKKGLLRVKNSNRRALPPCSILNCQVCSSSYSCTTCSPGYYRINNIAPTPDVCSPCISNCQTCADSSSCTACFPGFSYDSINMQCIGVCPANNFYDPSTPACQPCGPDCSDCTLTSADRDCGLCKPPLVKDLINGRCVLYQPSDLGFYKDHTITTPIPCPIPSQWGCAAFTGLSLQPYYHNPPNMYLNASLPSLWKDCYWNTAVCIGSTKNAALAEAKFCKYGTGVANNTCLPYFGEGAFRIIQNDSLAANFNCWIFSQALGCTYCQAGFTWHSVWHRCLRVPASHQFRPSNTVISAPIANCEILLQTNTSCAKCLPGFFPSSGTCTSCHPSCYRCSSSAGSGCTLCRSGYVADRLGSTFACIVTCSSNQYLSSSGACLSANPATGCETYGFFNSPSDCSSCPVGKRLDEAQKKCQEPCPLGKYADSSGACVLNCHPTCRSCFGPSSTDCYSCASAFRYSFSVATGTSPCSVTSSLACTANCLVCTSGDAADCIEPAPGYYLDRNRTLTAYLRSCPIGTYRSGSSCLACNPICAECKDSTYSCRVCANHAFRIGTACIKNPFMCKVNEAVRILRNSVGNECQACLSSNCLRCPELNSKCEVCKPGYYPVSETCVACPANSQYCHQLTGAPLRCVRGYFLHRGTCVRHLKYNETLSLVSTSPTTCSSNCVGCLGSSNNCTMCPLGRAKVWDAATNTGYCAAGIELALQGFYNSGGSLFPCTGNAKTCLDALQAVTCHDGFYFLPASKTCPACHDACKTCTGPAANQCTGCHMGFNLVGNECQPVCEKYEYLDTTQNICLPCSPKCLECQYDSSSPFPLCLSCPPGYYLSGGSCWSCPELCLKCEPSNPQICSDCVSYAVNDYSQNSTHGLCVFKCADGFYFDWDSGLCTICHPFCAACVGPSPQNCTACSANFTWTANTFVPDTPSMTTGYCVRKCPVGYTPTRILSTAECVPCYSVTCDSCTGPGLGECTICSASYFLNAGACVACHPSCLTCNGPRYDQCQSCTAPYNLDSRNVCALSCSIGQVFDPNSRTCTTCHPSCLACTYPWGNACTSCLATGSTPLFIAANSTCIQTCSSDRYYKSVAQSCELCNSDCLTCFGPLNSDCVKCKLTGHYIQVNSLQCAFGCSTGSAQFNTTHCALCHSSCNTCSGIGSNQCLSCLGTDYFNQYLGTCSPTCAVGYFPQAFDRTCQKCSSTCLTCSGPSVYDCLTCSASRRHKADGTCIKVCNTEFYYYLLDDACYLCDGTCLECKAATPLDCLSCRAGEFLNYRGNCLGACLNGTYPEGTKCLECSMFCKTCKGPAATDCLSCAPDEVLRLDGTCSGTCLPQQYVDESKRCQACHVSCESCSGPGFKECKTCFSPKSTLLSVDNRCVDCLNAPETDEETCYFNVPLGLTVVSQRNLNLNVSSSLRITFRNESAFLGRLSPEQLAASLLVRVQSVDERSLKYSFDIRQGEIVVDLFFEFSLEGQQTVFLTPKKQIILQHSITGVLELLFRNQTATTDILVRKSPDPATIRGLLSATSTTVSLSEPFTIIGAGLSILGMIASTGLGEPVLRMVRVFKLISRLRLINVFFGSYLELFLTVCGSLYKIGGDEITSDVIKSNPSSRGKLDLYKVSPLSTEAMWIPLIIYYISLILRLYRYQIRKYCIDYYSLGIGDQLIDSLAEKGRIVVLYMVGLDIFFYSLRSVSHIHLRLGLPTDGALSYWISWITLSVFTLDTLNLITENKNTYFVTLRRRKRTQRNLMARFEALESNRLAKELRPDSKASDTRPKGESSREPGHNREEVQDMSLNQAEGPRKFDSSSSNMLLDLQLTSRKRRIAPNRVQKYSSAKSVSRISPTKRSQLGLSTNRTTTSLVSSRPLLLEMPGSTIAEAERPTTLKTHGETSYRRYESFIDMQRRREEEEIVRRRNAALESLRLEKLRRKEAESFAGVELQIYLAAGRDRSWYKQNLVNPTSEQFFGNGIKLYKLRTFEGRYFNSFSLIKLLACEPFYIGMQLFQGTQVTTLLVLQIAYTVWTAKAGFKGIFESTTFFISTLFNELALTVFLVTGTIFQLGGGESNFSDSTRERMQFSTIGFLALACLLGFLQFVLSLVIIVYYYWKEKKLNKFKAQIQIAKEEKNLVRVRAVGEVSPSKPSRGESKAAIVAEGQAGPTEDLGNSSDMKILENSQLPADHEGGKDLASGAKPGLRRRRLITGIPKRK